MNDVVRKEILVFLLGLVIGGFGVHLWLDAKEAEPAYSEEYHIHADFLIQTNETVHEFGTAKFMTNHTQELHPHAHLHDNDGEVLHMHHENISFLEFLNSLGIAWQDSCLTMPTQETFCDGETEHWQLYVNGTTWTANLNKYVPGDLDQILLYFGEQSESVVEEYMRSVSDEACIYSGSCPERGVAPPESCGLTCEL